MSGLQGECLAGRYELGEVIGRGGMAEVRAGRDRRLRRDVAIKTLRADLSHHPDIRRRFEREARAAARLAHPNVVAVHDVGEEGGVPFIVMERITGPTLHEEMAGGPISTDRARQVATQILDALAAAHAAGIVHRDVKPGNVLVGAGGVAKVTDFGIAKAVDDDEGATGELDITSVGELVGTVAYMAPERLAGRPATVQSDLYSVGVILYEALVGTRPFTGDTPMAVAHAVQVAEPEPLAAVRPGLDAGLVAVIERAMTRLPEDRFTSAAEMGAALQADPVPAPDADPTILAAPAAPETRVLDAPPVAAAAPSAAPPEPAPVTGRARRPRTFVALGIGVLAALLALAASGVGSDDQPETPAGSPPASEQPATQPDPGAGIPPPLADALERLEGTLR